MKQSNEREVDATLLDRVPGRSHYGIEYLRGGRVFSFAHQIDTVLSFMPRSLLEIGVGTGVVTAALRTAGVAVMTLDVQPDLCPDLLGSVTAIPAEDHAFDIALCSQVLEHLPFEQFEVALRELYRVTRSGLVLSLPDTSPYYYLGLCLSKIGTLVVTGSRPKWPTPQVMQQRFDAAGHYWEIGYKQFPLRCIRKKIITSGWIIHRTWRVPEMRYHRFFDLRHPS